MPVLIPSQTILLIVDVQEKIFSSVERGAELIHALFKIIQGFQILELPIILSEQYPQGLGATVQPVRELLGDKYRPFVKTSFSCMDDQPFSSYASTLPQTQWIVVGIEAHICVLQTVKGLLASGKSVSVLNDAISSRSIYDFSTAIAEMRDEGARITSVETILFELIKDSGHPGFKLISGLIKQCCC
jgi:nicotinamidase-related amidase